MERFQNSLRATLNWFLDVRSQCIDEEGWHRAPAIANHLAAGYSVLETQTLDLVTITKKFERFDKDNYLSKDRDYRLPIADLYDFINKEMSDYVSHVVLLSSLATLDYCQGWSDVDALMVVKDSCVFDGRRLNLLRNLCLESWKFFQRITPLQHHGFIVITEAELRSYPVSCMPPAAMKGGISLLDGSDKIAFHMRPGGTSSLGSLRERADSLRAALNTGELRHHPYRGQYLHAHYANADNAMYQLFCMLGYVMTTPAYLMDALGSSCYKADSFARARPYFTDRAWNAVEKASTIRRAWPAKEGVRYELNAIPVWVRDILGDNYFEDWLLLFNEALEQIETHGIERQKNA